MTLASETPLYKKVPNILNRGFFLWTLPLFYNALKRDLQEYDLVGHKNIFNSERVGDILEQKWADELFSAKQKGKEPSLIKAMAKAFWPYYLITGILQFTNVAIKTVSPLLFSELLSYWSASGSYTQSEAVYLGIGLVVVNWVNAWFNHQGMYSGQQYGMKMRIAISSLIFRKIMRLDNGSLGDTEAGKVVNILSNDLLRLDLGFQFLHYVWIIPIQLFAICYLGYLSAGYSMFIGMGCLIFLTLPVQATLSRMFGLFRDKIAVKTDDRVKLMSEVINGIQVIKMYAWEKPFEKIVSDKRASELVYVKKSTCLKFIFIGFMVFTEKVAMFFTILTYLLLGNPFLATVIYPLQQYISASQFNFTLVLPLVLAFTTEMMVALKRVKEFLLQTERPDLVLVAMNVGKLNQIFDETNKKHLDFGPRNQIKTISYNRMNSVNRDMRQQQTNDPRKLQRSISHPVSDIAVQVHNVSCSWVRDPNILTLKSISLRIPKGKLCAIIGSVGSGKSSFLQLLLKELSPTSGTVNVNGKMAYACQEAWLFPSSVRENILFGEPYDPVKYKKVCKACCLEKDFKQFSYGDQTLVGERGVSLSGGQRARINLARAVYREVDIYLLDDPLSAVDTNVGRELFQGCINGYLKKKTRILVTHQIHFLKNADLIVVLNKGVIENMGSFEELASSGKEFTLMLAQLEEGKDKDADSINSNTKLEEIPKLERRSSQLSQKSEQEEEFEAQEQIAEERQSGNLKPEVFLAYLKAGGGSLIVFVTVIFVLLAAAASSASDFWISYWTNTIATVEIETGIEIEAGLNVQVGQFTTGQYIAIYGIIVFSCLILTKIKVFPLTYLCTKASYNLHKLMFGSVLNGIMRFFDTSSSGRILNRFAKDMGGIDEQLPRNIVDVLQIYSSIIGVLALNAIAVYYTIVPSLVLMVFFVLFVQVYMKTAQGVKRIEGTSKSPVFGMVSSSLNGIATIRSSGAEARLINDFDKHQDLHTSAWNCYIGSGNAFGFFLDTMCLIYLMIVILFCLFIDMGGLVPVGSVGLIVTQTLTLTIMLQHGARMLVELFAQMTSVERVLEYTKIESETNIDEGPHPLPPNWPAAGRIVFDNVYLKYGPDEKPVLKDLNITIEKAWKVGIVGRTGAGKTSLISALFRFAYIDGKISIDGINTADIGKKQLRTNISIIPQEPVLFSETIRYNMDPFNIYSDEEIWRAIEKVEMKDAIPSLDFKVTEGGANFSVGQRQLMCLARAVLRSNKILIMDEATANVDPQTDGFIQKTIRKQFKDCTVLTIAHRLNTIMDSDRVLVMDSGRAVEFDHPFHLLSNPSSHFTSMVRETGEKMTAQLFDVAKEAYFTKGQFDDNDNDPLLDKQD